VTAFTAMAVAALLGCRDKDPVTPPAAHVPPPSGRVVLHRLNRAEYDATVRDLLGTALEPAQDFPQDDSTGGFDNIADTLSMSPLHVELYELAARELADEVVRPPFDEPVSEWTQAGSDEVVATSGDVFGTGRYLVDEGIVSTTFEVPVSGSYTVSARVWADQPNTPVALGCDGVVALNAEVVGRSPSLTEVLEVTLPLSAGSHTLELELVPRPRPDGQVLNVDGLGVYGPLDVMPGPNPLRDRWVHCEPDTIGAGPCAESALRELMPAAWRRPVTEAEVGWAMGIVDGVLATGGNFEDALGNGVVAVLISPHFLYRVERNRAEPGEEHALDPYEVASRLSYFLWSSMPDDALFEAAARDELRTEAQISEQVGRMLRDPKADALIDNFAGQWLFVRALEDLSKDPLTFPGFDDTLRMSMAEEMSRFFGSFLVSDRDMHELLTATAWEIDGVLAAHYGVDPPEPGWHEVDLSGLGRRGILGQAGWLAVNAYPTRTSPVIRGKFVLGQLMCSEPPAPPPGVSPLPEASDAGTVRERLEQHRADPKCAACHESMDDIGFGLEPFDAVGVWRDEDAGVPIDATGTLFEQQFDGPDQLSALLAGDTRFAECVAEQTFTYALGRLPTLDDGDHLAEIGARFSAGGHTFEALAVAIATSSPFLRREVSP
jgi:hypothetical protein